MWALSNNKSLIIRTYMWKTNHSLNENLHESLTYLIYPEFKLTGILRCSVSSMLRSRVTRAVHVAALMSTKVISDRSRRYENPACSLLSFTDNPSHDVLALYTERQG